MTEALTHLPETCRSALAAIEGDPLNLPREVADHLRACHACTEARVQWLAQEEAVPALAPAGYFEALPSRVLRKLPSKSPSSKSRPLLWSAAAMLLGAAALGGFLAGRANRNPVVEATLPRTPADVQDRKSTRLNSSHSRASRMPSSA